MNRDRRKDMKKRRAEDRGQWASKTEYILAVAGNVVGLGNVWRFPYLCYKNGGGAFLVPYVVLVVVCGVPLFLLESVIGQYTQEGIITCWSKLCPIAQGIGYGQLIIKLYSCSYTVIQAWALFYLIFSFRSELPWVSCGNTWNTANCAAHQRSHPPSSNETGVHRTLTNRTSAATEFWERRVLVLSGGVEEMGSLSWELALCLLACWVVLYFSIWKGVRSSGKVVYFTATFPYVILLILLVRGLTLPGCWDGVWFYLYPEVTRLADPEVWIEAGSQIMFSYSLAAGSLTVLCSYNEYNNNCYRDCFWLCLLNCGTSFLAGFVVFSVLGFMAFKHGVPVDMVAESGPGLAFIVYPQATAMIPLPHFWTVCFFIMLILLSVDTQFVIVECFITSVCDLFPELFRAPRRHEVFVLVICFSNFLLQLLLVSEGGIYVLHIIDYYGCGRACLDFMAVFQCLSVGWIFGVDRFYDIIEEMTGQRPCAFFRFCWRYFVPLLCLASFILYIVNYQQLSLGSYIYPDWAYTLGWMMTLSSIIMVPVWGVGQMCFGTGTLKQRWSTLCQPVEGPVWQTSNTEEDDAVVEMTTSLQ